MEIVNLIVGANVDVPDINPDFSAPWMSGVQLIVSYILATALLVVIGALIVAIATLAFSGIGSQQMKSWAGDNIVKIFIAAAALGAVSGLFQWFVNFNFGF